MCAEIPTADGTSPHCFQRKKWDECAFFTEVVFDNAKNKSI